jgi:hypothetical protein
MKDKQKTLDALYDKEKSSNAYIINVSVKAYEDIFNNLDPAPFRRRDLNVDLIRFLEDCSLDIPLRFKTIIQFHVPEKIRAEELETRIATGLRNYFSFIMSSYRRRIKLSDQRSMYFVGISFLLLLLASFMNRFDFQSLLFKTINEGVIIGGWVFMWEAISSYSIKKREITNQYKYYKRFLESPIHFQS